MKFCCRDRSTRCIATNRKYFKRGLKGEPSLNNFFLYISVKSERSFSKSVVHMSELKVFLWLRKLSYNDP